MKANRGREPLKDRIKRNAAGLAMYASAAPADKSRAPIFAPEPEKPARAPRKPSTEPLESDIQRDIIKALRAHWKVAFVGRFNRGQAIEGNRRIWYNTVPGFPDIHGLTIGAKPFYFEVKRNQASKVSPEQENFMRMVRKVGGCAGLVYSVETAMELLEWL